MGSSILYERSKLKPLKRLFLFLSNHFQEISVLFFNVIHNLILSNCNTFFNTRQKYLLVIHVENITIQFFVNMQQFFILFKVFCKKSNKR